MKVFCLFLLLALAGCSTANVRIVPGENGNNKVVVRDLEKEGAEQTARKAAKDYCEEQGSSVVILKEKSGFSGKTDEKIQSGIRAAARSVSLVPGAIPPSSVAASTAEDRDFHAGLLFRCQKSN